MAAAAIFLAIATGTMARQPQPQSQMLTIHNRMHAIGGRAIRRYSAASDGERPPPVLVASASISFSEARLGIEIVL